MDSFVNTFKPRDKEYIESERFKLTNSLLAWRETSRL